MTNAELIQKIKAEIERLMDEYKPIVGGVDELTGSHIVLAKLLSFLSTLEEEKPMNQDELLEEVKRYYSKNFDYITSNQPTLSILTNIARHFAQWQKEQDDKELSDLLTIAHLQGADQMKEQMLKEAVEGVVCYGSKGAYIETDFLGEYDTDVYGNPGDKVRIIIVKED